MAFLPIAISVETPCYGNIPRTASVASAPELFSGRRRSSLRGGMLPHGFICSALSPVWRCRSSGFGYEERLFRFAGLAAFGAVRFAFGAGRLAEEDRLFRLAEGDGLVRLLEAARLFRLAGDRAGGGGTFLPSRRASESPMAMACLGFFTVFPLRPLLSFPRLKACISRSTSFEAPGEYFRAMLLSPQQRIWNLPFISMRTVIPGSIRPRVSRAFTPQNRL
jgi:hypothetical protein